MEKILTKQIADELMKIKGEARGTHFINDAQYVREKAGEEGLRKVEEELEKAGHPIKYDEIKNTGFYPAGLRALSLLAIEQALNWSDEDVRNMCKYAVGASLIMRTFMKFFYSVPAIIKAAPIMYGKYWTVGGLRIVSFDPKKKEVVIRVENFSLHPVYCKCLEGYFENVVKMVMKARNVSSKEVKCIFRKDNSHEYLLRW